MPFKQLRRRLSTMHPKTLVLFSALISNVPASPTAFGTATAQTLLDRTVQALGGADALSKIHGITFEASR